MKNDTQVIKCLKDSAEFILRHHGEGEIYKNVKSSVEMLQQLVKIKEKYEKT